MADRYWVGSSGNWSDATNHWSNSSGGSPNAAYLPTSADNVIFDGASNTGTGAFTVTVDGTSGTPSVCNNFSTSSLDGAMTLSMGATAVLECYGSMTLPATNLTWSGTTGCNLFFRATTTGKTITTNGVSLGSTRVEFNGVGGEWTLGSAFTSTASMTVTRGTFSTSASNYALTLTAFASSNSNTRTVTFNGSTITLSLSGTALSFDTATNLTFNANTSTITCSGASPTFAGGGLTFYNVTFSSAASGTTTINGANTFNSLTQTSRSATGVRTVRFGANQTVSGTLTFGAGNTAIRRMYVASDVNGTQRTITLNGTLATLADVDFQDIATAGTVGNWTGTRIGDATNNSGITTDAPKTVYWNLAGTQNWSATGWATTNNGSPAVNNFPLPQDTATFTEAGAAGTVTIDQGWIIGSIQMADGVSNRTTGFTLATGSVTPAIIRNVTLFSNLTLSGTGTLFFWGGVTQTITSAGISFTQPLTINNSLGTVKLSGNLTNTGTTFTLTAGTLDLDNNTLTCVAFSSSNSNTRSIAFGTGNITVTGNNATVWTTATATGFTYTGTSNVVFNYSGSTGTRQIFNGTSSSGGTESNALSMSITAGTDILSYGTGRIFKNLIYTGFAGTLTSSAITVYGNLTYSSGMTVGSTTGATTFGATSGTQTVTSNGQTLDFPITKDGAGTLVLQDNLTIGSTRTFTLTAGTLDLNTDKVLSTGLFASSGSTTRAISFGTSGQITVTGNAATVWNMATATNFTVTGTPVVNSTYSGSTGTRRFDFGVTDEANAISLNITAGTDAVDLRTANASYKNLVFTGYKGTATFTTSIAIYGNLTFDSGMTISSAAGTLQLFATSGTQDITSNGVTIDRPLTVNAPGATVRLQDALTIGSTRTLTHTAGTLNINGKTLSTGTFDTSNSNTRTLALGTNGTLTCTGSGTAFTAATNTGLSLTGTGTISMTSSSAKTFAGGGFSYPTLNQGGSGAMTITGANMFSNITNTTQPTTINFPAGITTTVTTLGVTGTAGNLVQLYSSTPGTKYTISDSSGITVVSYADIKDSNATGGAIFLASNSTNSGNNIGWGFGDLEDVSAAIASDGDMSAIPVKLKPAEGFIVAAGDIDSDALRLRAIYGDISANGNFDSVANGTFNSVGSIYGIGTVYARPKYNVTVAGQISALSEVDTSLYKMGEEWTEQAEESNTWQRVG